MTAAGMTTRQSATRQSYERMLAVEPAFTKIVPLAALYPNLPARTLFHAGPPFRSQAALPAPILNAASAAAVQEGFAKTLGEAVEQIKSGAIALRPAQDFGIVTPLAFTPGPSVHAVVVEDLAKPGHFYASPLNDGPPAGCLRFGTINDAGISLLAGLCSNIGAELSQKIPAPIPMLPILAQALRDGDELHGQVASANRQVLAFLAGGYSEDCSAYLAGAGQFVLNVVMATCALMMAAGNGMAGSRMVTACGGNGVEMGYKLAGAPDEWITLPATRPIGPKLPGKEGFAALPAIGDSAVIDALGFGAACLRFSPSLAEPLKGHVAQAYESDAAHQPYIGPHPALALPALPLPGMKLGLDLAQPRSCLGIMLGMVEETGTAGLIGRGVAPWPAA